MQTQLIVKLFISLVILGAALASMAFGLINQDMLMLGISGLLFFASIPIVKILLRQS